MKELKNNPRLSGAWDEDLDNMICVTEDMGQMCQVQGDQLLTDLPLVINVNELTYY